MAWRPQTLFDALEGGFDASEIEQKQIGKGPIKYQCACGLFVLPVRLVDCRNAVSVAQDWACDCCLSGIERDTVRTSPKATREAARKANKKARLIELGAPLDVQAKFS